MVVKQEPIDTWEEATETVNVEQSMHSDRAVNMNPVVKLNRIDETVKNIVKKEQTEPNTNNSSSKYWSLMEKIAEHELNLKLAQHEHEVEKIQREREIHQKNVTLLNLKIKVQQMQIDGLQGQNLFV